MLGNGDGTFKTELLAGQSVSHGVSGDFNEDGYTDMAVYDGNIKLLFGRGDGTFSNNNISFYVNPFIHLSTSDFNNDGHLDIFTSDVFYMGNGDGSFQLKELGDIKPFGLYTKTGDLNGDGKPDLLIDEYTKLGIWISHCDGNFEKNSLVNHKNYPLTFGNTIDIGDINGDSIADVVFVDGVSLNVLPGSGNGLFPETTDYIEKDLKPGDNVTAADFNGDANKDIAVSISSGDKHGVAIYYGRGNNTFIPGSIIDTGVASFIRKNKVFSKDINNDGYPDILYQQTSESNNINDNLYIILNKSGVTFSEPISHSIENGSSIVLDDIDNDGYVDIINSFVKNISYGYYSSHISIHKGSGDGYFYYETPLTISSLTSPTLIFHAVHDLNADGNSDLVVSTNDRYNLQKPNLLTYINGGGGTFSATPIPSEIKNAAGPLLAGDFDQDGMIDLVVNGGDGNLSFLSGNGDGSFKDEVTYAGSNYWNSTIISADFNLDGRPDLVSEDYSSLTLHLNLLPPLMTPPATPSHLKADSGDRVVTLSWESATEVNIAGYNIYRAPVSGGGYEKINSVLISSSAFTDTSVTNGIEYYYTVSAIDEGGEESAFAFKVVARPDIPDTSAPVVKITTPLRDQTTYNPSIFVSGTVSETGAKVFVNGIQGTVQKAGTFTAYGIPLNIGENTVSVTAVDTAGNHSFDSITVAYSPPATMEGTIKDEITGQPVQYIHVRVTDVEKSQEFFNTGADGSYSFVKIIPGEVTVTVESNGLTYYDPITVTKTITSGENLVLDIPLPLSPATIRGWLLDSNTSNYLSNATITITDPKKTQTLTANDYGYFEAFNVSPYQATISVASAGYATYTETVNVTNRWTNSLYFYLDPLPPSPPAGFAATPGKGYVNLAWNANSESNLATYKIYRSTTQGSGYQLIASTSSDTHSYADGDVITGTDYYYVIKAFNTAAQPSGYSAEVSAVPEVLPAPAGLTATPGKALVNLVWEAITESHVNSYNIYRTNEAGGEFALIGSGAAPTASYADSNVDAGVTYTYVVTAVNAWSREGGRSNVASAVPEAVSVGVTIISPYNGAYSPTSAILVKGTVESGDSPEVGVVLVVESSSREGVLSNRYLAEVNNGSFAAQIAAYPGMQNTLRAIATLPEGEQAATAITLYADATEEAVKLNALPANGILSAQTRTFEVTFEADVNVTGTITGYSWDFDGDGSIDQVTSTPAATFGYTRPGIYYPVVTVTVDAGSGGVPPREGERASSGMAYAATTVVNVMSMEEMNRLLKGKWEGMKGALAQGNIETAIRNFAESSRDTFRQQFTLLSRSLPQIVRDMGETTLIEVRGNRAISDLRTIRNGSTYSFQLEFIRDGDGLWRIRSF